jgi:hypothetical protein
MGLFKDCGCGCNGKKQEEKFMISIVSGMIFFIIANPETFRFVRRILGPMIASPTGCPTATGLLVHTVVFILIVWGMMNIKKTPVSPPGNGCGCAKTQIKKKKGKKMVVQMVDAPDPVPNFEEPQIALRESGRVLEPLSVDAQGTMFG